MADEVSFAKNKYMFQLTNTLKIHVKVDLCHFCSIIGNINRKQNWFSLFYITLI